MNGKRLEDWIGIVLGCWSARVLGAKVLGPQDPGTLAP